MSGMPYGLIYHEVMHESGFTSCRHVDVPQLYGPVIGSTQELSFVYVVPFTSEYLARMLLEHSDWLVVSQVEKLQGTVTSCA